MKILLNNGKNIAHGISQVLFIIKINECQGITEDVLGGGQRSFLAGNMFTGVVDVNPFMRVVEK